MLKIRLAGLISLFLLVSISGQAIALTLAKTYSSKDEIVSGNIVSTTTSEGEVEKSNISDEGRIIGIKIDKDEAQITETSDSRTNIVAIEGQRYVLVTNEFGPIEKGDALAISSIPGIAAKAVENREFSIGYAMQSYTGKTGTILSTQNSTGQDIAVGRILVEVKIQKNPNNRVNNSFLPAFIINLSDNIAGKEVSAVQTLIAMIVLIASLAISAVVIYSGVKNGVLAIGRNPLSKNLIINSMWQIFGIALAIFVFGQFLVYLILRL